MTEKTDTERRLETIEIKIDSLVVSIGKISIKIVEAIAVTSVQKNRIDNLDQKVTAIGKGLDKVRDNQSSCPRQQMKYMWWLVVPMGMTLLGVTFKLLSGGK